MAENLKTVEATAENLTVKESLETKKIEVKNDNTTIFKADAEAPNNVTIGGFTVSGASLHSGDVTSFSDTSHNSGVYVGTDGIRLGKNFTVSPTGDVTAKTLKTISSTKITYGSSKSNTTKPDT